MNLKIAHMYIPFDNKCGPGEHEVVEEEEDFHLDISLHTGEAEIPGGRS